MTNISNFGSALPTPVVSVSEIAEWTDGDENFIKNKVGIDESISCVSNRRTREVLVAMIAYLLLRLIQLAGYSTLSLQKIARLVSVNLTCRRSILALLNPSATKPPTRRDSEKQRSFDLSCA